MKLTDEDKKELNNILKKEDKKEHLMEFDGFEIKNGSYIRPYIDVDCKEEKDEIK